MPDPSLLVRFVRLERFKAPALEGVDSMLEGPDPKLPYMVAVDGDWVRTIADRVARDIFTVVLPDAIFSAHHP